MNINQWGADSRLKLKLIIEGNTMLPAINKGQLTMSSSQLGELLGYEKSRVNEKIRVMFPGEIDDTKIVSSLDTRGYVNEYHLPEVEATMFAAKWDINILRTVTEYFVNHKPAPKTFIEALELTLAQAKALEEKQQQLELQAPKVRMAEALFSNEVEMTFREFVNTNQLREKKFKEYLVENGVLYVDQLSGAKRAYSQYNSYFIPRNEYINGGIRQVLKITAEGAEYLVNNWLDRLPCDCFKNNY